MPDPEISDLITVPQAMQIIDAAEISPRSITIPLSDSSGLYLSADLKNDRDAPPFDKSLMDGYAVIASDLATVPRELAVIDRIAAGGSAARAIQPGEAAAIMTGAPLPAGADAVVPVESTEILAGNNRVLIRQSVPARKFVASRGSDALAGAVVLKSGSRIGPAQIAVAAAIGVVDLPVYAPASVAVLGTGDELVAPDKKPRGNQIRSSNNPMLMMLLQRYPCRAIDLGLVHDDPAIIEQRIRAGLDHDVLLVTGGMSMGERDFVPGILRKLGGEFLITKLRIKPGKPFVFAKMPGGKFVFGLPGNPVSAFVCTLCFVRRLLQRIAGGKPTVIYRVAPLAAELEPNGNRAFYQPAIFNGRVLAPLQWKGSADIYTLAQANALLIRPEHQPAQDVGASIEFIEI
jgi:molybdopterin molybdotransferase